MKTTPNTPRRHRLTQPVFVGAAASGALFALQHSVDAAVIYSGASQNVSASLLGASGNATATIQLAPGSDFKLVVNRFTNIQNPIVFGAAQMILASYGGGFVFNTIAPGGIKKLAAGFQISSGQIISTQAGLIRNFVNGAPHPQSGGTWPSAQTGFAGVKLLNGSLAWIRLEWTNTDGNPDPNTLTAIDWAYNDVPGESIMAGQTVVPEPGSTALLALAGAGAAALRRRRSAPAAA